MLGRFRTAAGILRRAAAALDGDNTGVISPPELLDLTLDEAADLDAPAPPQDPVTPEALALLRARGPADTIPDDDPPATRRESTPGLRRRFSP